MITKILKVVLNYSSLTFFAVGTISCATNKTRKTETSDTLSKDIVLIPTTKDYNFDKKSTSIEEYIISIPVCPKIRPFFKDMVRGARANYPLVNDNVSEKLFIGGDGSRGVLTFWLNRDDQSLRVVEVDETRTPATQNEYYLYSVPDGWLQTEERLTLAERIGSGFRVAKYWEGVGG